ncbi:3-hydroxyacyl-CoA dehydrogenase NAD-binding domain-containing protein [Lacibacter sp.]|uniref:3-hydroxyacyl-CoA dehydrogenase NAD-binding domain-containing protein n=1 Tax=Lacibacter sp. TaxID=1915409 RepID=UPI002B4AE42B|nr:3-hydroxyacyl-CoA dehydrogenase NAD-binding domain-containing protein [Lacibacter sp.]HLP37942.1 3-hydroxyacyl-CoA dehydrogenase NAD-binding domain-containing protein [Lacibacter sp.]
MVQTICVCGAGTMGSGIAQAAAQSGIYTLLFDLNTEVLQKAEAAINNNLESLVAKQKITNEQRTAIRGNIQFISDINSCIADVIIEAIIEKPEAKIALFNQLAEINHSDTIFASNTSSLSISLLQKSIQKPQRVAGLHFFNPATIMKLVEVVRGEQTNEEVIEQLVALTKQMNKTPVICKDSPGFIVNRVARPYYIEALRLVEEGVADFATVDALLEASGFKMGPFKLMDLIGNDINYAVSCSVYEQLGEPERLKPSPIQKEKVEKGELGRKTKKGYYDYGN